MAEDTKTVDIPVPANASRGILHVTVDRECTQEDMAEICKLFDAAMHDAIPCVVVTKQVLGVQFVSLDPAV